MTYVVIIIILFSALSQLQGVEGGWPGRREPDDEHNTPRLRRGGGIASSSFILFFYLYWYSYIRRIFCL